MHYDVKFGTAIVMTVTDPEDANALSATLQRVANSSGFQTEGLNASVEECDRGSGIPAEAPEDPSDDEVYYKLNAGDAGAWIRDHEDPDDVRALILTERAHPRYDGGRSGVLDDAEEYLGELLTEE